MLTPEQELLRATDAKQLLENPLFRESFDTVRSGITSAMVNSGLGDEKTHNRLVIALQLLDQLEKNIKTVMETGELAKFQVKDSFWQR